MKTFIQSIARIIAATVLGAVIVKAAVATGHANLVLLILIALGVVLIALPRLTAPRD